MKRTKITYWISTSIVALMMTFSAYSYLTKPEIAAGFHHLGYPDYFRVELAVAKLIGAVLLLAPVPSRLKEWTYSGFTIVFISAFIAHTASADPVNYRMMPLIFLAVLILSYISYHRLRPVASPTPATSLSKA
ncbi:MAG: DoxX family protein [Bacteroidetes bacterium]|nr:DoxX family protein [Bacteroidota bacterium]